MTKTRINVIGSGAWGTALANILAGKHKNVWLWARRAEVADQINKAHENKYNLSGIHLHNTLKASTNLEDVCNADIVLMVTPAQRMREILETMRPALSEDTVLVLCSKGIELKSEKLMSEVAEEIVPDNRTIILSGPNFAHEIAVNQPAGTTLAGKDLKLAEHVQNEIGTHFFRPYITDDVIGVQIAGALKNVIAIACGAAQGLGFGESTRASLVTRGMAEIARLGCAMGAQPETFLGLSGMGDMMLTCSSMNSRNFSLGHALGKGKTLADIQAGRNSVTEGVHTAKAAIDLAKKHHIDMPVSMAVYQCLHEDLGIEDALKNMLSRPYVSETTGIK